MLLPIWCLRDQINSSVYIVQITQTDNIGTFRPRRIKSCLGALLIDKIRRPGNCFKDIEKFYCHPPTSVKVLSSSQAWHMACEHSNSSFDDIMTDNQQIISYSLNDFIKEHLFLKLSSLCKVMSMTTVKPTALRATQCLVTKSHRFFLYLFLPAGGL